MFMYIVMGFLKTSLSCALTIVSPPPLFPPIIPIPSPTQPYWFLLPCPIDIVSCIYIKSRVCKWKKAWYLSLWAWLISLNTMISSSSRWHNFVLYGWTQLYCGDWSDFLYLFVVVVVLGWKDDCLPWLFGVVEQWAWVHSISVVHWLKVLWGNA